MRSMHSSGVHSECEEDNEGERAWLFIALLSAANGSDERGRGGEQGSEIAGSGGFVLKLLRKILVRLRVDASEANQEFAVPCQCQGCAARAGGALAHLPSDPSVPSSSLQPKRRGARGAQLAHWRTGTPEQP